MRTATPTAPRRPAPRTGAQPVAGRTNGHSLAMTDDLPPHSPETELAALACILDAGRNGSQKEVESLLLTLRPRHFYDLGNRRFFEELTKMKMAGHSVDSVTVYTWLTHAKVLEDCGGMEHWQAVESQEVSYMMFHEYADTLKKLEERRRNLALAAELAQAARAGDLDLKQIKAKLSEALEHMESATDSRPIIEIVTLDEARAYVPDPKTYLVGADMLALGEVCVLAGLPGLGKSRLANTLAFAGARGRGEWMGYNVRRKFRTLILQSENSMRRIQSEVADLPPEYGDWIRISKPTALTFSSPDFRAFIRHYYDQWPFDCLTIDPWSDVIRDEKFADYQQGLEDIFASVPAGDNRPSIVIVAHLKKAVLTDKPMNGRQLLGQISGSFRLGQKARTVFILQPATMDSEDDRVIFDCAKSNNDTPLPMSAWHRRNGEFLPCKNFDFDQWLNPPEDGGKRTITEETMIGLFKGGRKAAKKFLVEELKNLGYSQPTAYRALDLNGKFGDFLAEVDGLLTWKG